MRIARLEQYTPEQSQGDVTNGLSSEAPHSIEVSYSTVVGAFAGALVLCLLALPLFFRSPWVDEIMLFLNYPPGLLPPLTKPLEWYYQAATPLYSITIGQLGNLRPEIVRFVSAFMIAFSSIFLLARGSRAPATAGYALLAMLIFPQPLQMLSEMKHYGLEIVGCLLAIRWFIDKPLDESIGGRDVLVLAVSALLGLSTIPVAGAALGTHFLLRLVFKRGITRRDVFYTSIFCLFLLAYFAWVNYLMVYLTYSFTETYGERSVTENVRALASALVRVGGGSSRVLLFLIIPFVFVAYQARRDVTCLRLTVVTCVIGLAILVASAIGIYPARQSRFLTWMVAFPWFYLVTIFSLMPREMKLTALAKAKYAFLGMVLFSGFTQVWGLWGRFDQEFSSTANDEAISKLRALPPSNIGFWAGGEPVVDYYRRFYPDLEKHSYFGRRNWRSRYNKFDPASIDYQGLAESMLSEAPANAEFLVFASHYDIGGSDRYNRPKATGLHAALEEWRYDYEPANLKKVTIYRVKCSEVTGTQ